MLNFLKKQWNKLLNFLKEQWSKFIDLLKKSLHQSTNRELSVLEFREVWKNNAVYPGTEGLYLPKATVIKKVTTFKALFAPEQTSQLFWDLKPAECREGTPVGDFIRTCVFNVVIPDDMLWYDGPIPGDLQDREFWERHYKAFKDYQVSLTLDLLSRGLIQMSDLSGELYGAVVMYEPAPAQE